MRHPEVFLIPLLMLLDYFLTVAGSKLAARKYRQHFKFEYYEMNPTWQKSIAQGRWFCPRHLFAVLGVSFGCFVWCDAWREPSQLSEGMLGFFLILYAAVLAAHVNVILASWRILRHPEEVSGEITLSHKHLLAMSRYHSFMALFPVACAAWLAPSPFLYGGVASLLLLIVHMSIWSFNYRSRPSQETA